MGYGLAALQPLEETIGLSLATIYAVAVALGGLSFIISSEAIS